MENKSSLQFLGFNIVRSYIERKGNEIGEVDVNINPNGLIDNANDIFKLGLTITITDKSENFKVEVAAVGQFKMNDRNNKDIETFLYLNAPAILFPYVRAYISALTTLSGYSTVTLPTFNLAGLKDTLKNNTKEEN